MIKIQFRRKPAPPIQPKHTGPTTSGAYQFALRSAPLYHDEMRAQIERGGGARVFFSEPLSYIGGKGISLFRVEATGLDFLDGLYDWWAKKERDEAFPFDIDLYVNDREWVANLRDHTPDQIRRLIEERAPRVP